MRRSRLMGYSKQTNLDRFIDKKCYDVMYNEVARFVEDNPDMLDLRGTSNLVEEPDSASLCDMELIKTCQAVTEEDEITFDAIVSCELEIEKTVKRNRETDGVSQWFRLRCKAVLEDTLKSFRVVAIEVYSK
jgi:hypothetical protein